MWPIRQMEKCIHGMKKLRVRWKWDEVASGNLAVNPDCSLIRISAIYGESVQATLAFLA